MSQEEKGKISLWSTVVALVTIIWIGFQFYLAIVSPLHPMLQGPLHLVFALFVVCLYTPADKKSGKIWMRFFDAVFYAGIFFLLWYYISQAGRLTTRVQYVDAVQSIDIAAMIVMLVVLMESVRRILGLTLFFFICFFIIYMWFGRYFPSIFRFRGTTLSRFTELMIMGPSGILGTPLYTSVSSLFYFILFGVFFSTCGGGQLLIDLGMKLSNKSSGGPAKAAVISSGLMGMISGSAVANVSTTGVMTIPMMKKIGYEPEEAGAIEAVASTGGQIMPPIMGVGAFIMAEMLGVPYKTVAFSALIPAVAYYLSVFLLVSFMAKRRQMTGKADAFIFKPEPITPRLYLLIPVVVLVYFMVSGASLMRSGMMGIYAAIACNIGSKFLYKGKYYTPLRGLWAAAKQGIKQSSDIAIPTAACGIIIGIVIQSGLATKVSNLIASVGINYLIFALLIATLGVMLLGMALPTVAAYLVANILFVPTLIKLGIDPLVANMFVFYFGIIAQITPPVCLASFTAAGIAGADSWKTGWKGTQFAMVAFLIPFIFIYDPGILLIGSIFSIIKATAILFLGCFLIAAGMAGYLFNPLNKIERFILVTGAILVVIPETITDIIGFCIAIVIAIISLKRKMQISKNAAD
jgi:TRAP transporter 4TM/12TM fusion protein